MPNTYSAIGALSCSIVDCLGIGGGESNIMFSSSLAGVDMGVGDVISICVKNGALCGKGDISIVSIVGAGEDEGNGGVVQKPDIDQQSYTMYSRGPATNHVCPCLPSCLR